MNVSKVRRVQPEPLSFGDWGEARSAKSGGVGNAKAEPCLYSLPPPTEAHDDRGAESEHDLSAPEKRCVVRTENHCDSGYTTVHRESTVAAVGGYSGPREIPFVPASQEANILPVLVEYRDRARRRYRQTDPSRNITLRCSAPIFPPRNGRFRRQFRWVCHRLGRVALFIECLHGVLDTDRANFTYVLSSLICWGAVHTRVFTSAQMLDKRYITLFKS